MSLIVRLQRMLSWIVRLQVTFLTYIINTLDEAVWHCAIRKVQRKDGSNPMWEKLTPGLRSKAPAPRKMDKEKQAALYLLNGHTKRGWNETIAGINEDLGFQLMVTSDRLCKLKECESTCSCTQTCQYLICCSLVRLVLTMAPWTCTVLKETTPTGCYTCFA